jgi:hypothetical protein
MNAQCGERALSTNSSCSDYPRNRILEGCCFPKRLLFSIFYENAAKFCQEKPRHGAPRAVEKDMFSSTPVFVRFSSSPTFSSRESSDQKNANRLPDVGIASELRIRVTRTTSAS